MHELQSSKKALPRPRKGQKRKTVEVTKTDKLYDHEIDEKLDAPKVFGDLVTSDSIFAIKRNSTSAARVNDTTALVVKDKAIG